MSREYHNRRSTRSVSTSSALTWVIVGILVGVGLAVMFFWQGSTVISSPPLSTGAVVNIHKNNDSEGALTTKPVPPAAPEFDFYTVLPNRQLSDLHQDDNKVKDDNPVKQQTAVQPMQTIPVPNENASAVEKTVPPQDITSAPLPPLSSSATTTDNVTKKGMSTSVEPKTGAPISVNKTKPATHALETDAVGSYTLQIAAFKNYVDADRLKAELMMEGLNASIQPINKNGEIYNRVLIGPYSSKTNALQEQVILKNKHFSSILIKTP